MIPKRLVKQQSQKFGACKSSIMFKDLKPQEIPITRPIETLIIHEETEIIPEENEIIPEEKEIIFEEPEMKFEILYPESFPVIEPHILYEDIKTPTDKERETYLKVLKKWKNFKK
jgi:hypothetical protein